MTDDLTPTGEDTSTTDETQGESTDVTQPSHEDRLNERIAEITGRLPDLVRDAVGESMSQWQQSQTVEDDDDDEWALDPGDDGYEEQQLQQFIAEQVEQGVQRQLAPMQQQQMLDKRNDAWNQLTKELPDLADPAVAEKFVGEAHEIVEGNEQFVNSPRFVELVKRFYKAAKADERAQQQTAADGRTTPLESQGGAAPREDVEELDDRLAKKASSLNSF